MTRQVNIYEDRNSLLVLEETVNYKGKDIGGHKYNIYCNLSDNSKVRERIATVNFQTGPVPENGVNGLTTECLIAMNIDRLKKLNDIVPCVENENAIKYLEAALYHLELRTAKRIIRGVEGKEVA